MAMVTECPDCGAEVSDARFCRMCGTKLTVDTEARTSAAATAEPAAGSTATSATEPASNDAAAPEPKADPYASMFRPDRSAGASRDAMTAAENEDQPDNATDITIVASPASPAGSGEPARPAANPAAEAGDQTIIVPTRTIPAQATSPDARIDPLPATPDTPSQATTDKAATDEVADDKAADDEPAADQSASDQPATYEPTVIASPVNPPAGAGDQTIVAPTRSLADQPTTVNAISPVVRADAPTMINDAVIDATTRIPPQYPAKPSFEKTTPTASSGAETTQLIQPRRQVAFPGPPIPPPHEPSNRRFDPDEHSHTVMFIGFGVAIVAIVGLIIGFALLSSNTRATNRPPQVAVNTSAPPLPSATDTNPYASATPTSPATTPEVSPTTAPPATTAQDILPGAQGDDVKTVQRELRALGLYRGKISGKDSAATVLAISRFQQQEHITSDPPGVVGPTTAAALANAAGGQ